MTTLQDQINASLRDYVVDGDPGSGSYAVKMIDLRSILNTIAVGDQWIDEIAAFLNAPSLPAALEELGLGNADAPVFDSATIAGDLVVDTSTLVVDAVNNRVGIGTATPTAGFHVSLAALFGSTVGVSGAMTIGAGLTVDTTTLVVDAANNRVGINTATPAMALEVTGDSRFVASGAGNAVRILQNGTGNALLVDDVSNDTSPFLVDASGNVVIGTTATQAADDAVTPVMQVHGLGTATGAFLGQWSANTTPARLRIGKSRGTAVGTRGTVGLGDLLGGVDFLGDDGSVFRVGAQIEAVVTAAAGASDMPTALVFKTTPDGSATPVERLRILSTGFLALGGDLDTGLWSPGGNEVALWSGGGETMRLDEAGRIIIGHTDAATFGFGSETPALQIHGSTYSKSTLGIYRESDDSAPALLALSKSRGKASLPVPTLAGDYIGQIRFNAYEGATPGFVLGAYITAYTVGVAGVSGVATDISIGTSGGGAAPVERLRIASSGAVLPGADNTQSLGAGGLKWSAIYSGTPTIQTSDAREKEWLGGFNDAEIAVGNRLLSDLGTYKWLASIAQKGAAARIHSGVTAQNVAKAFSAEGLDPAAYASWCADPAENGGIRYGIRGESLLFLLVGALAKRVADLDAAAAA
jgi:hypothetical protein